MTAAPKLAESTMRIADQHFLSSLKLASLKQLYQMQRVLIRRGEEKDEWKRIAVGRELDRR